MFTDSSNKEDLEFYETESGQRANQRQMMIGDYILAAPFLIESETNFIYLPRQYSWFSLEHLELAASDESGFHKRTFNIDLTVPLFLKEGHVFLDQGQKFKVDSTKWLTSFFELIVALDSEGNAKGHIIGQYSYDNQFIAHGCYKGSCLLDIEVKMITDPKEPKNTKFEFRSYPHFPKLVGAIDHVEITRVVILLNGQIHDNELELLSSSYMINGRYSNSKSEEIILSEISSKRIVIEPKDALSFGKDTFYVISPRVSDTE